MVKAALLGLFKQPDVSNMYPAGFISYQTLALFSFFF